MRDCVHLAGVYFESVEPSAELLMKHSGRRGQVSSGSWEVEMRSRKEDTG